MGKLHEACERYLQLRRQLGYQLRGVAYLLRSFVAFAEGEGAASVSTDAALRWAQRPTGVLPATWADRLRVVRRFAVWLNATDGQSQVPPADLLLGSYRRNRPYIYSDAEIQRLVGAAAGVRSGTDLKGLTLSTVLGLLAVSGLRISEAIALDREDVDQEESVLRIRRSKFGKSRLVPVHESTCRALADYSARRDRLLRPSTAAFFVAETGGRVTGHAIRYNFAKISREIGLRTKATDARSGRNPRLHDFRHSFVVGTLLRWYRAGIDVDREMPKLSAYLGHVHVNVTYWYVEAVPELLALASRKLENSGENKP